MAQPLQSWPPDMRHEDEPTESQTRLVAKIFEARYTASKDGLIGFVLRAVDDVDWPMKSKRFGLHPDAMFQSRLLMALEVFCYARGVYDSNEIAQYARQDPDLAPLFKGVFPDANVIKKFRRAHRDPIRTSLLKIFDLGCRVRFGRPDSDEAPVDFCVTQVIDAWFEPVCGPRPDQEAERRLDEAVFSDNVLNAE